MISGSYYIEWTDRSVLHKILTNKSSPKFPSINARIKIFSLIVRYLSQLIKPSYDSLRVAFICGIASLFVWKILLHFVNVIPYISRYSSYLEHTGEDITRLGMWGYILFSKYSIENYTEKRNYPSPQH